MHKVVLRTAAIAAAIVVAACVNDAPIVLDPSLSNQPSLATIPNLSVATVSTTKSYLINFSGALPSDLAAQVSAAGGLLTSQFNQIGVAVASSDDPKFASRVARIKGALWASEDMVVQWVTRERVI